MIVTHGVFFFPKDLFFREFFSWYQYALSLPYHFDLFCFLFYCFASQMAMFWEHIKVFSFCMHNEFLSLSVFPRSLTTIIMEMF